MRENCIAVASADHVAIGRAEGFMQVNHGKAAPLRRLQPGSCIAYYSPSAAYRQKDGLQSFTAIGLVRAGEIYQGVMANGFQPFRRDVDWLDGKTAPIRPLLDQLEWTGGGPHWGQKLRFGLFKISAHDMQLIAAEMGVQLPIASV